MPGLSEHPLSPMQRGMLFDHLVSGTPELDVLQVVGTLRERLDVPALARAWEQTVERHPALRSHLRWQGLDEPIRLVDPAGLAPLEVLDASGVPPDQQSDRVAHWMDDERARGFDLARPPLARLSLASFSPGSHALILTVHHILLDAVSFPVLLGEVFQIYEAVRSGRTPALPPTGPEEEPIADSSRSDAEFWRQLLEGVTAPTLLCSSTGQAPGKSGAEIRRGATRLRLSEQATDGLRRLAASLDVTLNALVQTAWALLLSRYCGEDDVLFGTVRRTSRGDGAPPVGLFINTLPMRVRLDGAITLAELARQVRTQHRAIGAHRHTPLVEVRRHSEIPGRTALFDSFVVFNRESLDRVLQAAGASWRAREFRLAESLSSIPLGLYAYADPGLELRLVHDRARCDDASAARILEHLACVLSGKPDSAQAPAVSLPMLTPAETRLLERWSGVRRSEVERVCVHELIEERVRISPDAVALVSGDREITYRELDRWADALAGELRRHGVGRDVLVGIHLARSIEMVVAILATLKAGGAYLPLDPDFPSARLAYMLEDARVEVVLSEPRLVANLPGDLHHVLEVLPPDVGVAELPRTARTARPSDLAYVIYTSGSTGNPKGVMVEHRNVVNFFRAMDERVDGSSGGVWLAVTSLSFDISVLELLWTLTRGVRVALYPGEAAPRTSDGRSQDGFRLGDWLVRHGVTHLQCTPSMALMMTLDDTCREGIGSLRQLLIGGEAFPAALAAELRKLTQAEILNMYGPTETTIWSSTYPVPAEAAADGADASVVPIGWPVRNTRFRVLGRHLQPVPPGLAGELLIGGDGVARGYLNRPSLTRERFVRDPQGSSDEARLYRTGDLVAHRADGCLQFLGRIDNQVKIRGHRIEPAEIEHQLEQHPGIQQAVVVASESAHGDKHLRACLVPEAGGRPSESELRAHLRERLPEHMVPGEFLFLEDLPLTPNKKLDRKSLAAFPTPADSSETPAPARDGLEAEVAAVWRRLLGRGGIGRDDNFFDLGGDSFLAMKLHHELRAIGGGELSLTDLFRYPTVRLLAGHLGRQVPGGSGVRRGIDRGRARRLRQQRNAKDGSR